MLGAEIERGETRVRRAVKIPHRKLQLPRKLHSSAREVDAVAAAAPGDTWLFLVPEAGPEAPKRFRLPLNKFTWSLWMRIKDMYYNNFVAWGRRGKRSYSRNAECSRGNGV